MELHHGSDCLTNLLFEYFWVVEKTVSLQKEGYSSNQGSRGDSRTRRIWFQWVRCARFASDKTNISPLSPLEGNSK
ncbi:tyrosine-sulfated glycopeptide receptor 1-like [Pyrus ussuriensis x Pyrus communis]|uniref:Tyrosine-sulfated glycopeptide receptor 1-like n=1 Tax=Pyrus ussuriensis x Pyrus communis TaxID=2448454 RepID=A0A5N5FR75_9ROSA|nr:tyrosine-sulfated glycopeptide receptor 1-like [Pyrus ussuriensis x Pyrus communis]